MAGRAPFFIVGAGRSGTTLLRLILTGHSRLHIPPETWFLRDLVRQFPLTGALTQPQAERAVAAMVRHERWPDLGLDADEVRRAGAALAAGAGLRDVIELVIARLLAESGKQRLGDKTPHYFEIVPELATLFPDAVFIYLVRDGRDVAMSWIDAGWQRYYEPGFEWPRAMGCLRRDLRAYPDRVLEVRYEDLVRRAEDTTRRICEFLGEDFEPAMLDWHARVDQVAERDRHLHGRLSQPLSDDAVAAWRRLSGAECFAMEAWLHRALREGGYALRFDARGWMPVFFAVAGGLRVLAPVLRRGIPYLQKRGMLPRNLYF
ncbi:MAG TPA: sulfotransferase [Acetobacteraceae bacterium]|nr:sulfotransferase [Acetobacteraceae bacterium]